MQGVPDCSRPGLCTWACTPSVSHPQRPCYVWLIRFPMPGCSPAITLLWAALGLPVGSPEGGGRGRPLRGSVSGLHRGAPLQQNSLPCPGAFQRQAAVSQPATLPSWCVTLPSEPQFPLLSNRNNGSTYPGCTGSAGGDIQEFLKRCLQAVNTQKCVK